MKKEKVNYIKHIELDKIENPLFLKDLSYNELDVLSDDIRKKIIDVTSKLGGHLSSNLGVVELTIALHRVFDLSKDKLIFDVGHQCYTHKILTGRNIDTLRQENGISGFQKMSESPYDAYEAGHSSTAISAANGFAIARDLNNEDYNIIAFSGDASIVSGLSFEAMNNLGRSKHKVIIILNDNGMSISKPVGGLSKLFANISTSKGYNKAKSRYLVVMQKTRLGRWLFNLSAKFKNWFKRTVTEGNIFTTLGFAYIGPVDGHNIKKIEKALLRAKNTKKSVVIHACTIKGKGYKFAEEDKTGLWHGVSPFNKETGEFIDRTDSRESWSNVFSKLTNYELEQHQNSLVISPATIVGAGLTELDKKYDSRVIDVGIAEEHALTLASALYLGGKHPIVSIYSTFLQRAYDEVSHDLARMNCDATVLVDRAGLVGSDGETHQGIYDESYLSSIPNIVITMPSNIDEAKYLYDESFKHHGPFFIRIPRTCVEKQDGYFDIDNEFGKWIYLSKDDSDLALIGVGPALREIQKKVQEENLKCTLVNAIYINPIDKATLDELMTKKKIIIYDQYSTSGGLVNLTKAYLLDKGYKGLIKTFCVPNEFVKQATISQQLNNFKISVDDVIEEIKRS